MLRKLLYLFLSPFFLQTEGIEADSDVDVTTKDEGWSGVSATIPLNLAFFATHLPSRPLGKHLHTYTQTDVSFLQSHKVTVCRYKLTEPSDKWDLACSINTAAKSQLLSVSEPYLSAVGLSYTITWVR